jgi:hypothetical protein
MRGRSSRYRIATMPADKALPDPLAELTADCRLPAHKVTSARELAPISYHTGLIRTAADTKSIDFRRGTVGR